MASSPEHAARPVNASAGNGTDVWPISLQVRPSGEIAPANESPRRSSRSQYGCIRRPYVTDGVGTADLTRRCWRPHRGPGVSQVERSSAGVRVRAKNRGRRAMRRTPHGGGSTRATSGRNAKIANSAAETNRAVSIPLRVGGIELKPKESAVPPMPAPPVSRWNATPSKPAELRSSARPTRSHCHESGGRR